MGKISVLVYIALFVAGATSVHAQCGSTNQRAAFMGPDHTPAVVRVSGTQGNTDITVAGWSCQLNLNEEAHLKCTRPGKSFETSGAAASFDRCGPGDFYIIWNNQTEEETQQVRDFYYQKQREEFYKAHPRY